MPEGTIASYVVDHWFKPVLVFALGLVGYNLKNASSKVDVLTDKVNEMPDKYINKNTHQESMRGMHQVLAEIRTTVETQRKENREDRKVQHKEYREDKKAQHKEYMDGMAGLHKSFDDFKKDNQ